ncbi:hypothetical protein B9Z55_012510 [Caenorhabditis nigoni]|uniref:DUF38 domain-containing protein n=1 Tax=Caenorhabditis nigoni TaxID=1611254 RepID=A0A2G5TXP8_9PELO|nr:hypothetical protein B9Z55_012510 [Caenorhabditis nigoni]
MLADACRCSPMLADACRRFPTLSDACRHLRLILRDASAKYWKLIEYEGTYMYFVMKILRVTRAHEKVKIFLLEYGRGVSHNLEYWRCQEDGRTMIWKGYHANFYSCRRSQQWASHHLHYCLQRICFGRLIFKTEERNKWDPEIDPFCNFYKQLATRFKKSIAPTLSPFVESFEIELNWFDNSDQHNRIQTWQLFKLLDPGTLKFIEFRKWMDTMEHGRRTILTMSGWEEINGSNQWKAAEELDILDENMNMEVKDYINFNVVKLHLQAKRILIFSEQLFEENELKTNYLTISTSRNIKESMKDTYKNVIGDEAGDFLVKYEQNDIVFTKKEMKPSTSKQSTSGSSCGGCFSKQTDSGPSSPK